MKLFDDPVHQEFAEWGMAFAPFGGADVGELEQVATQVRPADDGSYHDAFRAFAERRIGQGDGAAAAGRTITARDCYLRASAMLGMAYHPLYGTPVDPRLVDSFHLQMATFEKYLALGDPPAEPLTVPYEGTTIPAWFVPAPGSAGEQRPVVLVGGGWDSCLVENHLGIGLSALDRGYHVVLHDGPGQGKLLIDEGLPLRHDWEHVVTPVVDATLARDDVDADRIAYVPWSLGGFMAPRAAAFEHRLAAVVADPGQRRFPVEGMLALFGLDQDAVARLPEISDEDAAKVMAIVEGDRNLHWMFVQRGFWTNGATDLASWLAEMWRWRLDDETIARIRTPILVTSAEGDRASTTTDDLYAAIQAPKARLTFTAADGAAQHCAMLNRSLANREIFDWIDETFHAVG